MLARLATRHARLVLAAWVFVAAIAGWYAAGSLHALNQGVTPNPKSESTKQADLLQRTFPDQHFSLLVLLSSERLTVDDPMYNSAASDVTDALRADPSVGMAYSYFETGASQLVSRDRHQTFLPVVMRGEEPDQERAFDRLRQALRSEVLRVRLGGVVAVTKEIGGTLKEDIAASERLSFAVLAVLLVFIFRSIVGALIPLIIGAVSIAVALALARVVANFSDVTVYAANIITFLGLGLAIDYSLFLLSRFREELDAGSDVKEAVTVAMHTAGRTVAFSGSIVGLSLLGLLVFPRNFLYSMAIGGAAAVFASVLVSLTILPALLTVLGRRVDKGKVRVPAKVLEVPDGSFWAKVSHAVMRRAGTVVVTVLAILFLAGSPFLRVRLSTVDARTLPETFESRQVTDELQSQFDLPSNPIQIMLRMPGDSTQSSNLGKLKAFVDQVKSTPGVAEVRSQLDVSPFGDLPRSSGNITTVDVTYHAESQSKAAQQLVDRVRAIPAPEGATKYVGGATANLVDLVDDITGHAALALAIIVIATFVLLLFMLRSILVPVKAIIFNALSLTAAFGGLVWVFQDGHLQNLVGFKSNGAIDANVPVLIFVIAFGLAVDYEVFLVSRMKEAHDAGAKTVDSVAFGLERTGQIITSAALLLLVVIGAFTMGRLSVMKQLGFGLGLAIFVDATLVRSLLVPATMKFLGEYNWYVPQWLGKLIDKARLGE